MFGLIKMIFGVGLLALVFGLGYLWGSQKSYPIQSTLNTMRSELTSKIEDLELHLRRTRIRMELMNARNHLLAAQTAVEDRNFGKAQQELDDARAVILKVAETATPPQDKALTRLASTVHGIQKQVIRPNPPTKLGVDGAIRVLDQFLS